ncbi:MAG: ArsA family ATPase [Anaerolineales bacterium]|nr:ArsA family ATPase [Anaerolineales bacterium]
MRILLYTGKGGVGKTSIAAATALRCADLGYRTIVLSTDTAHSLGDSLEIDLGPEPIPVTENLWGQEVDVHHSIATYWGRFQDYMASLLTRQGVEQIVANEVAIIPGLDEGASLLWLNRYVTEKEYEVIVVDAAPTAETLRLLSLPETGRWWYERLIALGKGFKGTLGVLSRTIGGGVVPDNGALQAVDQLFKNLEDVRQLLSDPAMTSIRLVINAEKMVIKETQRTFTYLNLYGYNTDAVVCNRLIPDSVIDPYFSAWKELHARNQELIREAFDPLPIIMLPLFDSEVVGFQDLRRMAQSLFQDNDPTQLMFEGRAHWVEPRDDGGYDLVIQLPFVEKSELQLHQKGDELTLRAGAYRRNFILPRILWNRAVTGAGFVEGLLRVHFSVPG